MSGVTTLPLDPTPVFTSGLRGQAPDKSSYKQWDFLKADNGTPGSAEHYHDPLEKKAFKPNWTQLRHVDQIKPYEQRMAQQADREAKREKESTTYKEQIKQRSLQGAFNPITGTNYDAATQSWQPATDPWAHRKPRVRPEQACKATQDSAGAGGVPPPKTQTLEGVANMRRQRLATDGLTSTRKPGGGVKELLQWGA